MSNILYSSVDIIIPEFDEIIGKWRKKTVADASLGVPPHITLLWPWFSAPVDAEHIDVLRDVLSDFDPFTICFNGIKTFGASVIYLSLEKDSQALKLMERCAAAFPEYPLYKGKVKDPVPHVTIAKAESENVFNELYEQIDKELSKVFPLCFDVKAVTVMEQQKNMKWTSRERIRL